MKNRIDTSRSKTPWDNFEDNNCLQNFIMEKYKDSYNQKHPKLSNTNESNLLNNISVTYCRHCDSKRIVKRGKTTNGIQLYYCNDCKKRFTPLANTIFDGHKISITEWVEFLLDIFNYGSTSLTSKVNKNAINTSIFWLYKVFIVLREYQHDIVLSGAVYIDEFFYKVTKKDIKTKDGKQLRGLSKNQYCIGIGYDKNNIIATVEGLGKTSSKKTEKAFYNHIKKGSRLIHDEEKSHKVLIDKLGLIDESYCSMELKQLDDEKNPLRPINHQCDLLRQFLNTHSGFDRDDLQDYLNLYCFMNSKPRNKLEKVNKLLELALTKKVSIKYRDVFKVNKKNH